MTRTLLVMIKPDGVRRRCTASEVTAIKSAWADLLAWLHGADLNDLAGTELLRQVVQAAGLQMVRSPEYDIRAWELQARDLDARRLRLDGALLLSELVRRFGIHLGFDREIVLNAPPDETLIGLIYQRSPRFAAHRKQLMPRLLSGPVEIQLWRGERVDLAFSVKILIRRALSTAAITNLLHMDVISPMDAASLRDIQAAADAAATITQPTEDQAA